MMVALVDWFARSLWTTFGIVILLAIVAVAGGYAFELTLAGATALYFVVWWTVLFMILPVRIRTQAEAGEVTAGTEPAAPHQPALRERAIWTSIASTILFVALSALFPLSGL